MPWALLLAALLGVLGAPLHLVVVRHAVCPEHGELLHVPADVQPPVSCGSALAELHGGGSCAPRSRSGDASAALVSAGADGAEVSHAICECALLGRESFVPASPPARVAAVLTVAALAPRDQTLVRGSFPRFLLAPKQSPPPA